MNVSPECDCWGHNDAAIVPDLGIAASFDPVALDRACADLVNAAPTLRTGNELSDKEAACCPDGHHSVGDCCCHGGEGKSHPGHGGASDKFNFLHPDTNWSTGLDYAEQIGLGSNDYTLIRV